MSVAVLSCEGTSEVQLMESLLETNSLIFDRKSVLDRRPMRIRQPKDVAPLIEALPLDAEITFYRIGDTQKDEFNLERFSLRKERMSVIKVCTKPEIEILIIINEGLYKDYMKEKSGTKPKEFVRTHGFPSFKEYLDKHDLTDAIREYKRIKKNRKNEAYLADLLKG